MTNSNIFGWSLWSVSRSFLYCFSLWIYGWSVLCAVNNCSVAKDVICGGLSCWIHLNNIYVVMETSRYYMLRFIQHRRSCQQDYTEDMDLNSFISSTIHNHILLENTRTIIEAQMLFFKTIDICQISVCVLFNEKTVINRFVTMPCHCSEHCMLQMLGRQTVFSNIVLYQ